MQNAWIVSSTTPFCKLLNAALVIKWSAGQLADDRINIDQKDTGPVCLRQAGVLLSRAPEKHDDLRIKSRHFYSFTDAGSID